MVVATWVALENVDFLGSGAVVEKKKMMQMTNYHGPMDNKNNDKPWCFRVSYFQTNVSEPNINLDSLL